MNKATGQGGQQVQGSGEFRNVIEDSRIGLLMTSEETVIAGWKSERSSEELSRSKSSKLRL